MGTEGDRTTAPNNDNDYVKILYDVGNALHWAVEELAALEDAEERPIYDEIGQWLAMARAKNAKLINAKLDEKKVGVGPGLGVPLYGTCHKMKAEPNPTGVKRNVSLKIQEDTEMKVDPARQHHPYAADNVSVSKDDLTQLIEYADCCNVMLSK